MYFPKKDVNASAPSAPSVVGSWGGGLSVNISGPSRVTVEVQIPSSFGGDGNDPPDNSRIGLPKVTAAPQGHQICKPGCASFCDRRN